MKKLFAVILTAAMLAGCSYAPPPEDGDMSSGSAPAGESSSFSSESANSSRPDDGGSSSSAPDNPSQSAGTGSSSSAQADASQPAGADSSSSAQADASQPAGEGSSPSAPANSSQPAADWISEHGITITPQGSYSLTLQCKESFDDDAVTADFNAGVTASITETREGVAPGEKKVVCVFTIDCSGNPLHVVNHWTSAFDRYTGTSFEFSSGVTITDLNDTNANAGYARIPHGDSFINISIDFSTYNDYPIVEKTISVTCPADYDGVVFQIGYDNSKMVEQTTEIMAEDKLHTIDEMPYIGAGYLYFSLQDR